MLSHSITRYCFKKGWISEDEQDIYEYGFDITIYTVWSTAVLLLIGFLLHQTVPAIILVFGFYTFQTIGGGYHANTHFRCFSTMVFGLLTGLSFSFLKEQYTILWCILGASGLILIIIPLVLHPNKAYLEPEMKHLSIRSFIITILLLTATVILNSFYNRMFYVFSAVFFLAALSRIAGKIAYQNHKIQSEH